MVRSSTRRKCKPHSASSAPLRIGCSGWQYKAWRGAFYPVDLPTPRWFEHYAQVFDTVEINNTFYRLPEASTFARWSAAMPKGFVAAVKASRFLTHLKRLRDPAAPIELLLARAAHLGAHLGPLLYQLPASMRYDRDRLDVFLDALPRTVTATKISEATVETRKSSALRLRHVIEFRDPTWYRDDVFGALERSGVSLCLHDKAGSQFHEGPVGPIVYVRFHGTSGHYAGSYPDEVLAAWAARLSQWTATGRESYAYFNNDPDAAAIRNARGLKQMAERE
jgi:uncharacterized protein YecE (DUF72 family)